MKFGKLVLGVVATTVLLTSCGTTKLKGEKPVMKAGIPEVIDYQGQSLGSTIPAWVMAIGDGAQKKVKKSLDLDKTDTVFILQNKGSDLDFLKVWTDQVDARAEVAASIEQSIGQTVEAELEAKDIDVQTKARAAKIYSGAMTNVTLNGLTKEASYWIKTRTLKTGVKKAKSEADYTTEYTYYVVYSIKNDIYSKQIAAAMNDIDDNDDQTSFLKDVLTKKLTDSMIGGEGTEISFDLVPVEEIDE